MNIILVPILDDDFPGDELINVHFEKSIVNLLTVKDSTIFRL